MKSLGSTVLAEPAETLVELDHQELIVPVDFDDQDLETWMQAVPTAGCGGGGEGSPYCGSHDPTRPGPV
ncbi:hypothetical protein KUM39_09970 [Streptomyces sp. J2-1]|uniref:hypothetical protein n=1 Tax=Streptomyces corallincola TaxID=2851888 RepID=UPI001C388F6F|nr:hypothetical protein [Streptomyces corallincola]MBV2354687.1 hypothetical protein [Streptomyces corallincola]